MKDKKTINEQYGKLAGWQHSDNGLVKHWVILDLNQMKVPGIWVIYWPKEIGPNYARSYNVGATIGLDGVTYDPFP